MKREHIILIIIFILTLSFRLYFAFQNPNFDHESYFIFEKQIMLEVLKFFTPFLKDNKAEKICLSVKSNEELEISIQEAEAQGNRIIPITNCSPDLIGKSILVSKFLLYQLLENSKDLR